jgi:hypothetical protein
VNTVILRNIPNDIMSLFRKRAAEQKTSLNKAVIGLLQEAFGSHAPKKKLHHDLDEWLAESSWTREEADAFNRQLLEDRKKSVEFDRERQRKIDEYSD